MVHISKVIRFQKYYLVVGKTLVISISKYTFMYMANKIHCSSKLQYKHTIRNSTSHLPCVLKPSTKQNKIYIKTITE